MSDFFPEGYEESCLLSRMCIVPFVREIKNLLKKSRRFTYIEDENKKTSLSSKVLVMIDGSENIEIVEKYPSITVGRSAIQVIKPSMDSSPESFELGSPERVFGDALQSNCNIKIEAKSQAEVEDLASFIFINLRINAVEIGVKYNITDLSFNYMSQPVPLKGGNDSKTDVWQIGINCNIRIDERIMVVDTKLRDELESEWEANFEGISENLSIEKDANAEV